MAVAVAAERFVPTGGHLVVVLVVVALEVRAPQATVELILVAVAEVADTVMATDQ